MRRYLWIAWIAFAAGGLLTGAAWIARHEPAPEVADTRAGRGGSVWGANYFPNVPLITHDGREVRFFDDLIKDRVVAINFIYTTCPDACPMETARLLEVAQLLGDRMGRDVFFYSISIDPDYDTVPVLAEFTRNWGIGEGWKFLTGREEDITLLRKKLGVYVEEIQSETSQDHNLSLVIGNQATGRWMKRSPYENPYILANQLGRWLHNWKTASAEKRDYADAPKLRKISTGENLFRTRCASCHTIGRGDVVALQERRIGPDLFNVGRLRDRDWLVRWLAEPDAMLAEKDPLAMALLAEWQNVPMPNLRLNGPDIDKLLGYIDQESRRVADLRAGKLDDHGDHGSMDHGSMDHGSMDHGSMDHGSMDHGEDGEHASHSAEL